MRLDLEKGRMLLRFQYSAAHNQRAKQVPGSSWNPRKNAWSYPLNLKTARLLFEQFGEGIRISDELKAWSKQAVREERRLRRLVVAPDADLARLDPTFAKYLRDYQRADVAFMAERSCINANEPGLGKTTEVVAATLEADLGSRPNIVISPLTSLDSVWRPEIERWTGTPAPVGLTPARQLRAFEEALELAEAGEPVWFLCNPEQLKTTKIADRVRDVQWGSATIDEFQMLGLSNPKTALAEAVRGVKSSHKWALSGTPIGGVPLEFWAVLNWIDPKAFASRWQWAEQWLDKFESPFGASFGGLQAGREREFYNSHAPYLLRRLKSEVAPDLPPKKYRHEWVTMRPAQRRQYESFERDAEIRLSGELIVATTKLAEWQRLKLFAFGSTRIEDGAHLPTTDSPKLDRLVKNLRKRMYKRHAQTLVFSQFSRVVDVTFERLREEGFRVESFSGKTKNRSELVRQFQSGDIDILVMVTKAAGVSITLDAADYADILDRTWNPNDQVQAEDRAHRISRIHQLIVTYYGTHGTLDETIQALNLHKLAINASVLDEHRAKLLTHRTRA